MKNVPGLDCGEMIFWNQPLNSWLKKTFQKWFRFRGLSRYKSYLPHWRRAICQCQKRKTRTATKLFSSSWNRRLRFQFLKRKKKKIGWKGNACTQVDIRLYLYWQKIKTYETIFYQASTVDIVTHKTNKKRLKTCQQPRAKDSEWRRHFVFGLNLQFHCLLL